MNLTDLLQKSLMENGHRLAEPQQKKILLYLNLLQQWNQVYNLTAIKDPVEAIKLHVLDSLSVSPYLHGRQIVDVGTGAGLPGILLALTQPERSFVLLDSNRKKTCFLLQAVSELQLKNVTIINERVENFHPKDTFDSILTRAFSSLAVMLPITEHLAGEQGLFLAMKGIYSRQELREIPPKFKVLAVHQLKIVGLDVERHLICFKKECAWEK